MYLLVLLVGSTRPAPEKVMHPVVLLVSRIQNRLVDRFGQRWDRRRPRLLKRFRIQALFVYKKHAVNQSFRLPRRDGTRKVQRSRKERHHWTCGTYIADQVSFQRRETSQHVLRLHLPQGADPHVLWTVILSVIRSDLSNDKIDISSPRQ